MYGLDLFSGIGGITRALEGYVWPIAYCERDPYAQAVLLSNMRRGLLPMAPIFGRVQALRGTDLPILPDIIYGGFPCQDISVAGRGEGLEGEQSGLFFEIVRLVSEIRPRFVFLENVSAITVRGAERVVGEFCRLRYDCRWGILSASDVGANHERARWWLLAHAMPTEQRRDEREGEIKNDVMANAISLGWREVRSWEPPPSGKTMANPTSQISHGLPIREAEAHAKSRQSGWWATEPNVGRVANGIPRRVDRLRGLGNAVVPAQAREAFERLMGLKLD